jgi:hypothetical protein
VRRLVTNFCRVALFAGLALGTRPARADGDVAVLQNADNLGYTFDDEWRGAWNRILDRTGRPDSTGPIQQRFNNRMYPEHGNDRTAGDFMLGRERAWAEAETGARFWIHSYDALSLGNKIQLKLGRPVGETWNVGLRYDAYEARNSTSKMVRADFKWEPPGEYAPLLEIAVFPRLEKQDTDVGLTVGYRWGALGETRLRVYGLDAFMNGSYALARNRKPPADLVWQQLDVPLAFSFEMLSGTYRGLRSELYVGAVVPQRRALHLGGFVDRHVRRESAILFGHLLEYQADFYPLWIGAGTMIVNDVWETRETGVPDSEVRIDERSVQSRLYAFSRPQSNLLLETQLRHWWRPESVQGPGDILTERQDREWMYHARGQWLMNDSWGMELAYWYTDRDTAGPPDVFVDGVGNRIVTRFLLQIPGVIATWGVGWDPFPRRALYAGGGGTVAIQFD